MPTNSQMRQIGEVATAVGLSLRTIRYYEEADLAPPSGRSTGGFRLYTDADVERLRLVKQMKPLDLTIDEMRQLLTVRDQLADPATSKPDRTLLAERLSMFAELAEKRCQRLSEQLDTATQLSATLHSEADAAREAST